MSKAMFTVFLQFLKDWVLQFVLLQDDVTLRHGQYCFVDPIWSVASSSELCNMG